MQVTIKEGREFEVTVPRTYTFKAGWGVFVDVVWDESAISAVEVEIVHITPENVFLSGGVPCVICGLGTIPVENFKDVPDLTVDDSHDLRTRYFSTKVGAETHAQNVRDLWKHPNPWTAFCVTE